MVIAKLSRTILLSVGITKVSMVLTIFLSCLHGVGEFWMEGFLRVQSCLFSAQ